MDRQQLHLWFESLEYRRCLSAFAFVPRAIDEGRPVTLELTATTAADIDGDGDLDVLASIDEGGQILIYRNEDGSGAFSPGFIDTIRGPNRAYEMIPSDLDGDGDIDIVTQSREFANVSWYENSDGEGRSWINHVIHLEFAPAFGTSAALADIDGDGDEDIISTIRLSSVDGWEDSPIFWYENLDGAGSFAPRQPLTAGVQDSFAVVAGDIDNDGDLDLAVSNFRLGKFVWYENVDGRGTFGPETVISATSERAFDITLSDVDQDGDLDAYATLKNDSKDWSVVWFENVNGLGAFGPENLIANPSDVPALGDVHFVAGGTDIDGDGDSDAVWTDGGRIFFSTNDDGLGSFGAAQVLGPNSVADRVQVGAPFTADVDADGDADLVVGNASFADTVIWYEHMLLGDSNDDGQFDSADFVKVFRAGEYEDDVDNNSSFEEGDWNGDGDFTSADLVLAFRSGNYEAGTAREVRDMPEPLAVDAVFAEVNDVRKSRAFVA